MAFFVFAEGVNIPWNIKLRLGSLHTIFPLNVSFSYIPTAAIFLYSYPKALNLSTISESIFMVLLFLSIEALIAVCIVHPPNALLFRIFPRSRLFVAISPPIKIDLSLSVRLLMSRSTSKPPASESASHFTISLLRGPLIFPLKSKIWSGE